MKQLSWQKQSGLAIALIGAISLYEYLPMPYPNYMMILLVAVLIDHFIHLYRQDLSAIFSIGSLSSVTLVGCVILGDLVPSLQGYALMGCLISIGFLGYTSWANS